MQELSPDSPAPEFTGPFTDLVQQGRQIIGDNIPQDLQLNVLILTFVIAVLIWLLRNGHGSKGADGRARKAGFLKFILPRDIYTHASARVDVGLYLITRLFHAVWGLAILSIVGPWAESLMIDTLQALFGNSPALQVNIAWMLFYSLVSLLFYDFVFFLTHYAFHKVPALWAIHKVHHSAEVLTPLTRYREHFIAGPVWLAGQALSFGLAAGIFAYLFSGNITEATLLNISFFFLLFGFNGSFRHYHVQFHYPRWLSKWLQSPAMHHVHHSYLEPHWDKNLSVITSLWDRLFGTLYIPEKDEYTPWGIGHETQDEHRSLLQNVTGPFRDWWRMLKR